MDAETCPSLNLKIREKKTSKQRGRLRGQQSCPQHNLAPFGQTGGGDYFGNDVPKHPIIIHILDGPIQYLILERRCSIHGKNNG